MAAELFPEFLAQSLNRVLSLAQMFGYVEDDGVMGVLRESLIEAFLEPLLMPPYRAGTGVIIDSKGNQSGQCDIIIWDDSIFRPLYTARCAGIYLIESVVAILEIKSTLKKEHFRQPIQRTREFKKMSILRSATPEYPNNYWGEEPGILPITLLFGFRSNSQGSERDRAEEVATEEDVQLREYLQGVMVPGKDAWMFQDGNPRRFAPTPPHPYHELLMPFAALLNSLKELSHKRGKPRLGAYMVPYFAPDVG